MKLKSKVLSILVVLSLVVSMLGFANITQAKGGSVYVHGYTRKNGTYVAPYYRSAPDSSPYNNYSYPGNTNPYTGKTATGNPYTYLNNYYKAPSTTYSIPVVPKISTSTLSCATVDGMSIYGYSSSTAKYKFIGSISNQFGSKSIANEFGAGNQFSLDSIFNQFGSYGSLFSSYSSSNQFASTPPLIVNSSYKAVGYLTVNTSKYPSMTPDDALACAKNSFMSGY